MNPNDTPVNNSAVMISPTIDSLLRAFIVSAGTVAVVTGKATPDQINILGTSMLGAAGALAGFGSLIWGVVHKNVSK